MAAAFKGKKEILELLPEPEAVALRIAVRDQAALRQSRFSWPPRLYDVNNDAHALFLSLYTSTVSSSIMTAKPTMRPTVAGVWCPFLWVSGITSCDTTKSIAPAAKPRPVG